MTNRKEGLARTLLLVQELAASDEGYTIEQMADMLGQGRRSAERTRALIGGAFDLTHTIDPDSGMKKWRIQDGIGGAYAALTAEELAALDVALKSARKRGSQHGDLLARLLAKLRCVGEDKRRLTLEADLFELSRLQSSITGPGPRIDVAPDIYPVLARAIMLGQCAEFEYVRPDSSEPQWRRVIPYGIVQGQANYLLGKIPDKDDDPFLYRMDRMQNVRVSETMGSAPEDFDLDAWLAKSFGIWREAEHEVTIRVLPHAADRARHWRFHATQKIEDELCANGQPTGALIITFRAGGLSEMADHLFLWAGDTQIIGPELLIEEMRGKLTAAAQMITGVE
ncbi:WYL domain-containing protein [Parasphingorhabdus sp.]|uniref:WYL domain-containing protein n=1 Tax=Parasphingorhabdus sp. TaxID=2709688 RepID=UPI002F927AFC